MKSNYHVKQIEAMHDYLNGLQLKAHEINELAEQNYHTIYPIYDQDGQQIIPPKSRFGKKSAYSTQ